MDPADSLTACMMTLSILFIRLKRLNSLMRPGRFSSQQTRFPISDVQGYESAALSFWADAGPEACFVFVFVFCSGHRIENVFIFLSFFIPFSVHVCPGSGFSYWQHLISEFLQALTPVWIALTASAPWFWRPVPPSIYSKPRDGVTALEDALSCPSSFSDRCLISCSHHTPQAFITRGQLLMQLFLGSNFLLL